MAKINNVSGEEFIEPNLEHRLIEVDEEVDVDDEYVYGFTAFDRWEPADDTAQQIHDQYEAIREANQRGESPPPR